MLEWHLRLKPWLTTKAPSPITRTLVNDKLWNKSTLYAMTRKPTSQKNSSRSVHQSKNYCVKYKQRCWSQDAFWGKLLKKSVKRILTLEEKYWSKVWKISTLEEKCEKNFNIVEAKCDKKSSFSFTRLFWVWRLRVLNSNEITIFPGKGELFTNSCKSPSY